MHSALTLHASPDIFRPLFEVSVNPAKHPNLHHFLKQVVGIDCVDDESKPEKRLPRYPPPKEWNTAHNPPYSYYLYYLYVTNSLRSQHTMATHIQLNAHRQSPLCLTNALHRYANLNVLNQLRQSLGMSAYHG